MHSLLPRILTDMFVDGEKMSIQDLREALWVSVTHTDDILHQWVLDEVEEIPSVMVNYINEVLNI